MTAEKLKSLEDVVRFIARQLESLANPTKAEKMAAYLKTEMPFYGVYSSELKSIFRDVKNRFEVEDDANYRDLVLAVWALPHREEKQIALLFASHYARFITSENLDLFERLIREGAWWDLVDHVAPQCVGTVLLHERATVAPIIAEWNSDDDVWIRRSSIICQLKHKEATDAEFLFEMCRNRMHETEFFIRKAIGWSLREYAKHDPDRVVEFLETHRDELAGLSFREAAKHLIPAGRIHT